MRRMPPRKQTNAVTEFVPETSNNSDGTLTFKTTHFYAVMVVLAFAVGIIVGYVAWGRTPASPVVMQVPPQAVATATLEQVKYEIPVDGHPILGPDDAPITIVEFSDYQCPYCTRWHEETYQQVLDSYPGQIRFVYRNYPLSFHQNAMLSAQAALCAGEQNQYWTYHDKLFTEKNLVNSADGSTLDVATYVGFATDLELDAAAFETCLSSEKYVQQVQDDVSFANSLPTENGEPAVSGTPTFFINGKRLVGAYPFQYFKQIIDAELAALN